MNRKHIKIIAASKQILEDLKNKKWLVDIHIDKKSYKQLASSGFDKDEWENNNKPNRVVIENV